MADERDDDAQDEGRRMDPELLTLGRILRMLESQSDASCRRIVGYLNDRYVDEARREYIARSRETKSAE